MTRCHVCERPCVREVEPAFSELPAVTEPDIYLVAQRNGIYVDACFACWFRWPDEHKVFPAVGYGRWPDDEAPPECITLPDIVAAGGPA